MITTPATDIQPAALGTLGLGRPGHVRCDHCRSAPATTPLTVYEEVQTGVADFKRRPYDVTYCAPCADEAERDGDVVCE